MGNIISGGGGISTGIKTAAGGNNVVSSNRVTGFTTNIDQASTIQHFQEMIQHRSFIKWHIH